MSAPLPTPTPPTPRRRSRRGVALVMAVVILAALLLLGLPFLSSQSTSLIGSRVFSDAQRADLGVDTATRITTALAMEAVREQFTPTSDDAAAQTASAKKGDLLGPAIRFDSATMEKAWEKAGAGKASAPRFVDDKDLRTTDPKIAKPPPEVLPVGRFTFIQFDELLPAAFQRTAEKGQPTTRPNATLIGAVLEDESGKLNPNTMSVATWDGLLKAVFGTWETGRDSTRIHDRQKGELQALLPKPTTRETDELTTWCELFFDELPNASNAGLAYTMDWDDNQTLNSRLWGPNPKDGLYYQHYDLDSFGELARALAELPHLLPGGRITDLDQLLLADTHEWKEENNGRMSNQNQGVTGDPNGFGLRRPLTRTELDRLRPYLSLHTPAPGRNGLIDLGTLLFQQRVLWWDVTLCDVPSWSERALGWGLGFRTAKPHSPVLTSARRQPLSGLLVVDRDAYGNPANRGWYYEWGANGHATVNDAIAFQAQAPINFFTASRPVLRTMRINRQESIAATPEEGLDQLVATYGKETDFPVPLFKNLVTGRSIGIPQPPTPGSDDAKEIMLPPGRSLALWNLRDTRSTSLRIFRWDPDNQKVKWARDYPVSMPPLGWTSAGVIAISSIATTTDGQGRQVAARQRRTIIQAVPHERPMERRWTTQAEMDDLNGQVFTSNLITWPNPVERLWQDPNEARSWPDHLTTGSGSTFTTTMPAWRAGPMPGLATGCQQRLHKWPAWRCPEMLEPYVQTKADTKTYRNMAYFGPATNGVEKKFLPRPVTPNIDWCVDFGAASPIRTRTAPKTGSGATATASSSEDPTWPRPFIADDDLAKRQDLDVRPACSAPVSLTGGGTATNWLQYLQPDGLHLDGRTPLAYPILDEDCDKTSPSPNPDLSPNAVDASVPHGVLRRANRLITVYSDASDLTGAAAPCRDMGTRHIGLWIKPETDWTGQSFVTLLEARMPLANASGEIGESKTTTGLIDPEGKADPSTRNTANQNLLSLSCDVAKDLLVLSIAPPSIPHTWDCGPQIPWDDPLTADLDERCGGSDSDKGSGTLAPLAPASWPGNWSRFNFRSRGTGKTSALSNISQLIAPNCLTTIFSLKSTATSSGKYFRKGKWSQIQVVIGSSRPGGAVIIVDGVPGRDVLFGTAAPSGGAGSTGGGSSRNAGGSGGTMAIKEFGDQCTLGALPLATAIPLPTTGVGVGSGNTPEIAWTSQGSDLALATVDVQGLTIHGTAVTAEDLFPSRGMVRINDEYILYQSVKGNSFSTCMRAQRQNTNTGYGAFNPLNPDALNGLIKQLQTKSGTPPLTWPLEPDNPGFFKMRWPRVQNHVAGTLVMPAGFRLDCVHIRGADVDAQGTWTPRQGRLYMGGATLADPFPSGDPAKMVQPPDSDQIPNPNLFRIWAALPDRATGAEVVQEDPKDATTLTLFPNGGVGTTIPLDQGTALGVIDQFPLTGGIVLIPVWVPNESYDPGTLGSIPGYMQKQFYSYASRTKTSLNGVQPVTELNSTWELKPAATKVAYYKHRYNVKNIPGRTVYLVSIKLKPVKGGTDLLDGFHYRADSGGKMIQLMDATTGRIEWIGYDHLARNAVGANDVYLMTADWYGWNMRIDFYGRGFTAFNVYHFIRYVDAKNRSMPVLRGTRGLERTDFAGRADIAAASDLRAPYKVVTKLKPDTTFLPGSFAIPVQSDYDDGSLGHCLATGDVLTVMPKQFNPASTSNKPLQVVVRYAATDGHPDQEDGPYQIYDVHNERFAFAHFLPEDNRIDMAGQCELLCGNAWSPSQDLTGISIPSQTNPPPNDPNNPNPAATRTYSNSPLNAQDLLAFAMPRLDLLSTTMTLPLPANISARTASSARLVIGGADTDASRWPGGTAIPKSVDLTIDGLFAGAMPMSSGHPSHRGTITHWLDNAGAPLTGLADTSLKQLPCLIEAHESLDTGSAATAPFDRERMGLIRIGGEIFAFMTYSRPPSGTNTRWSTDATRVRLVARGLLGSKATPHVPDEPFLVLPMGPVALLDGTVGEPPLRFHLDDGKSDCQTCNLVSKGIDSFDAPVALICKPDGSEAEVMGLFGTTPEQCSASKRPNYTTHRCFHTAGWCRGLYNTPIAASWTGKAQRYNSPQGGGGTTGSSQLQPVVIGWWPRFPSAMPMKSPTNAEAMYRCRLYGWLGIPQGMNSSWFWPDLFKKLTDKTDQNIASITLLETGNRSTGTTMDVEVKAMAMSQDLDWTKVDSKAVTLAPGVNDDSLNALFENPDQFDRAVDGAEIRVFWRYKKAPVASTIPSQFFFNLAEAGSVAPAIGPVKFRCLAPTRVLAVEGQR